MNTTTNNRSTGGWRKYALGCLGLIVFVWLLLVFFPWDLLRQPINRYVSEQTGRKFEIKRHLDVQLGWRGVTVYLDGLSIANPSWARDPYLIEAERMDFELRVWPLLSGKVDLPRIRMEKPTVGLQMDADGRRTWALGSDTSTEGTTPKIGLVQINGGMVRVLAPAYGIDLNAKVDFDSSAGELPLSYDIGGTYKKQPFRATGRTGNALQLTQTEQPPFPLEVDATAGSTHAKIKGTVAQLQAFEGIDAAFDIKGQSLGRLYDLLGIALPETSPYALKGRLLHTGKVWEVKTIEGQLGLSDLAGELSFDPAPATPKLTGKLSSKVMDMDDLGPLIGLPPTQRAAAAVDVDAPKEALPPLESGKVLPTATLDFERLRSMNADVDYQAISIRNVRQLPLDSGSVHVVLQDAVLNLSPLDLGVASGHLTGAIKIDASAEPAQIDAKLRAKDLQIDRMIPKVETLKTSFGKLHGNISLAGPGVSVAGWLGGASGDLALVTGRGKFSNLLLELMGLDGGEAIRYFVEGDRNVTLRCAAFAFAIDKGIMSGRTLVFDTDDTVFYGSGDVSLAEESLDLVIRQEPKDVSILSLRTPITIKGTFASPSPGVEAAPLAKRGIVAAALAAVNPILALLATVETGPGEDADCKQTMATALKPGAVLPTPDANGKSPTKSTDKAGGKAIDALLDKGGSQAGAKKK